MNVPYVKKYKWMGEGEDKRLVLANPIQKSYMSFGPNRKQRRLALQKDRFYGESKNHHLTIIENTKYLRHKQIINFVNKEGEVERRVIHHYLLQK